MCVSCFASEPNLTILAAVPKPKGGVGIGGTSPPSIHRSQSGVSMTQCDSVESAISSGLLCHSVPGSPYSGK